MYMYSSSHLTIWPGPRNLSPATHRHHQLPIPDTNIWFPFLTLHIIPGDQLLLVWDPSESKSTLGRVSLHPGGLDLAQPVVS
jgi:hypothetical protein